MRRHRPPREFRASSRHPKPNTFPTEMNPMYDMYPDWGPARHSDHNEEALAGVQAGLDLRDNGGQRPDDN